MAYWRLHYHLVWATLRREPLIDDGRERVIHRILSGKAAELRLIVHAIGNVQDHIHVVVSIPPKLAVAECVGQLKGASSHAVNHGLGTGTSFAWQEGYGALSVSERSLPTVVAYVRNQKQHHDAGTVIPIYERTDDEEKSVRQQRGGPKS